MRWPEVHYHYLGRVDVTPTAHFICLDGKNIVIDYGVGFERIGEANMSILPEGNLLKGTRVDMIIVSHKHIDHIGAIVRLAAEHPEALVVISGPALRGGEIILQDSLKIAEQEQKRLNHREMIFDYKDLEAFTASDNLVVIDESCTIQFWPGWTFGFHWSGHDVGAMMVFIIPPNDRPVFLTGDCCSQDQETVAGVMLPDKEFLGNFLERRNIVMITEATNGAKKRKMPREQVKAGLIDTLKMVRARGGQVLLPTYASTKSSNVLLMLVEVGIVPHLDGLARKMAEVEIPHFEELVRSGSVIVFEDGPDGDYHRMLVARGEDPCGHSFSPIIAPSATLDKGRAVQHAREILPNPNNALIFTGYMFETSLAKQIFEIDRGRTINLPDWRGEKIPVDVRCDIHYFDLSSHDYQEDLVERVRLVRPAELIVHHADRRAYEQFAFEIMKLEKPPYIQRARSRRDSTKKITII